MKLRVPPCPQWVEKKCRVGVRGLVCVSGSSRITGDSSAFDTRGSSYAGKAVKQLNADGGM